MSHQKYKETNKESLSQRLRSKPHNVLFPRFHSNLTDKADNYREYVSKLAGLWPGLSYLDSYLNHDIYLQRVSFPITLIKSRRNPGGEQPEIESDMNLETLLRGLEDDCDQLIILEDPTPNMIAELGGKFEIDPQFFADFLVGPSWFGSGNLCIGSGEPRIVYRDDSLLEQLWPLPSAAKGGHACFRFVGHKEKPADLNSGKSHSLKDKSLGTSVRSLLSTLYPLAQNAVPGPHFTRYTRLRRSFAIWQHERSSNTTPWIGVIIMQNQSSKVPISAQRYPYIFRNFLKRPLLNESIDMNMLRSTGEWEGRPQRTPKYSHSLREIYCRALEQRFKSSEYVNEDTNDPNFLFVDLLQLIGCFWVTELESRHLHLSWMNTFYLDKVAERRERFSWRDPLTPNPTSGLAEKLQSDLISLHAARIDIGPYHHLLEETKVYCQAMKKGEGDHFDELGRDFGYLQNEVSRLQERIIKTADFLHSISEEFERERSSYRNRLILILTLWTFLYSPISLTSSIMNLNEDKGKQDSTKVGDIHVFWKAVLILGLSVTFLVLSLLWVTEVYNLRARKASSLAR